MGDSARGGGEVTADTDDELTDYERRIIANVQKYGCHITSVASAADEEWEPPFSYSVGFIETVGQPEVIVLGLSSELRQAMINDLLDKCRDGLALDDWARIDDLLDGHQVVARTVCPQFIVREYLNSAMWYEGRRTGRDLDRVMQLVWPGANNGLFPWDENCSEIVREYQPALYEKRLNA